MKVTPDQIVAAYRRWHVPFVERPGWRTDGTGHTFDPVGLMIHHDALNDGVSTTRGLEVIEKGRPDLKPPLAQRWHEDDGLVYLTAHGNANHAGSGAGSVLDRVRKDQAPLGNAGALGLKDTIVGNAHFIGSEVHNAGDGRDPYEPGQMQSLILHCAAMCELHSWTANRVIGHCEWTRRKPDPAGIDMAALRHAVAVCLYVGPDVAIPTPRPHLPPEARMYILTKRSGQSYILRSDGKLLTADKDDADRYRAAGVQEISDLDDDAFRRQLTASGGERALIG